MKPTLFAYAGRPTGQQVANDGCLVGRPNRAALILLLLVLTATCITAQNSGFEMFVSGSKTVTAHSNFDSVTLKHNATGKEFLASNYQWVISTKGSIHKGTYPADKLKLQETLKKLRPNDILFIEMAKADNGKLLIKGQYAFKIE